MRGICFICFAVGLLMIEEIGKNPAPREEELCNFKSCEFILEARLGIFLWPSRQQLGAVHRRGLGVISHQVHCRFFPSEQALT